MITIGSNTKIKNSIIGRDVKKEKELQERINKAIEYIEQLEEIETYYPALTYRTYRIESKNDIVGELLDILKGSDSNG